MTDKLWKPDICIYHGPDCADGFGAAYAVWKRWGDAVEYVPMNYGTPMPVNVTGKDVIIVDFSLKRCEMNALGHAAKSIIVLDHHKTAQSELAEWGSLLVPTNLGGALENAEFDIAHCLMQNALPIIAWFDMEKSGARLAWEFCHPGQTIPLLLEHVEDRDLWRFDFPYTKHVSAAIQSYDKSFDRWDVWAQAPNLWDLIHEGGAILRARERMIASMLLNAYVTDVGGFQVPVVNVPYQYASDSAHVLLQMHPEAPFAAAWFRRADGKIQYSLRSENTRQDVSEIAKSFGGGGHRNAAGFEQTMRLTP